jgi:hypothetical protein
MHLGCHRCHAGPPDTSSDEPSANEMIPTSVCAGRNGSCCTVRLVLGSVFRSSVLLERLLRSGYRQMPSFGLELVRACGRPPN